MTIPKNLNIVNLSSELVQKASEFLSTPCEDDLPDERILNICINILIPSILILSSFLAVAFLRYMFFHSGIAGFILFLSFAFYLGECIKHYDD